MEKLSVGIMGAGSIGCYLGGALAAAGATVTFIARERVRAEIAAHGLTLVELGGAERRPPAERFTFTSDVAAVAGCDAVLCCVKSGQTVEAGEALAKVLPEGALVVSAQNGVGNAEALRGPLPGRVVLAGIVGFNVRSLGNGVFRRGTSGPLAIESSSHRAIAPLVEALRLAGFEVEQAADLRPMQWSKLVVNLANAVNALSGVPTREMLQSAGYRQVLRAVMAEAVTVLGGAGIPTARIGPLPVQFFPTLLGLPSPLFRLLARAQLKVDPEARASMYEDLLRGRDTEIEELNGEIVRLAEKHRLDAPVNRKLVALVHEVEAKRAGTPNLSAADLSARLGLQK
ncbi:MAG: 2-dehydropantoate 2-reductase [Myxococcaceae bacterium]